MKLSGFGNFQLRDKPQRPGRNPKTGEEIPITARRVVTFHASQKLKAMVEQALPWTRTKHDSSKVSLPPIPAKRYFTIGEVSELCGVKPHVLRYWEQEFTQLKPVKRRGNRRYYQHHEVLLIRRIRELLYEEGFTISGARNRLDQARQRGTGQERRRARAERRVAAHGDQGRARLAALTRELRGAASISAILALSRGVAQPGSVPAWGAGGRRFKSSRPDQLLPMG